MNIKKQHDEKIANLIERLADKGCKKQTPSKQMIESAMTTHPST